MKQNKEIDVIELTSKLIQCESVTPAEAGALDLLEAELRPLGLVCQRLVFGEGAARVDNLYAVYDSGKKTKGGAHFCFAGHVDVVPAGDVSGWQHPPFSGAIADGYLWGRGAVDMKGAVAAFVAALASFLKNSPAGFDGKISLLITGDEEGVAINGTKKMLEALVGEAGEGVVIDDCLVGEPTNVAVLGDTIKVGRRGSVNVELVARGVGGHVAYPHKAANPLPDLARLLAHLAALEIDAGSEYFEASNLEIVDIEVGNAASNVIPEAGRARFNIRYNDLWTADKIEAFIKEQVAAFNNDKINFALEFSHSGDAFITSADAGERLIGALGAAIEEVAGRVPELSTAGGTSDARFIKNIARVAEFGLISETMHKTDERVAISDIENLQKIYEKVLENYFNTL